MLPEYSLGCAPSGASIERTREVHGWKSLRFPEDPFVRVSHMADAIPVRGSDEMDQCSCVHQDEVSGPLQDLDSEFWQHQAAPSVV